MLKFLDYGKPYPFGGIFGKPRNLAWPVNAYRVTLPRTLSGGDGLNPFERVVLKLLDAVGVMDAHALADETRIPLDLVKRIPGPGIDVVLPSSSTQDASVRYKEASSATSE